jgi:hypothetical protein
MRVGISAANQIGAALFSRVVLFRQVRITTSTLKGTENALKYSITAVGQSELVLKAPSSRW